MPSGPVPNKDDSETMLEVVNRQIGEIKKKIQLSEGQRKAHYEECDTEKKRNIDKIRTLKKTIKQLQFQLGRPPKCDEGILKTSNKYPKETIALRSKDTHEAAQLLDCKVIDLQKKLDLIRYHAKMHQKRMKDLADEYQELLINTANEGIRKQLDPRGKQVSVLENNIHKVEMNMMEAEHMRKKYRAIRASLLEDSVLFESTLNKLEHNIMKQETEIRHLQAINREALDLRDSTKGILLRQEVAVMNAGKSRERQLMELKMRVDERKAELERLERRIFPTGRPLMHQDTVTSTDMTHGTSDETSQVVENLEKAFTTLKEATGVTDTKDVLQRFLSQIETRTRLTYLKETTEKEKKQLEVRKDMMLAELEAFKFAQVKDKEQNEEEVEKLKIAIQNEIEKRDKLDEQTATIRDQILQIKNALLKMCSLLQDYEPTTTPPASQEIDDSEETVVLLQGKLHSLFDKIDKKDEPEEEEKVTIKVVRVDAPVYPQALEGHPDKTSEPEDEDEIPTRGFLKRQAQVIIDAKSRRKGFRVAVPRVFGRMK
ncbi:outer dynein arm-docking complex subunit 3 [Macrosteles quadrilineatus]|uniref:outer dynein arm-docking complex subunit 3 n=1 Tax=Macrosteles quadrilineatus TaxID=74068 RepID=UPI0023E1310E|nr:outer dynein arm-docking complex subunit 3 [Macrosteles quadrilineatus]